MNVILLSLAAVFAPHGTSSTASDDLVLLTPMNIAHHGYWVRCGVWDKKRSASSQPVVYFRLGLKHGGPLHKGPFAVTTDDLQIIKAMTLMVRDGDTEILNVPLRSEVDAGNEIHLFAKFTVKRELLPKLRIDFVERGESDRRTFAIRLNAFMRK